MNLTFTEFNGVADITKVKAFLLGRKQQSSQPDYWSAGKSTVGTFQTLFDSPTSQHKFWCDDQGQYQAYLWLNPEASVTIEGNGNAWRLLIHPKFRTPEVTNRVIARAEDELSKLTAPGTTITPKETVAYGKDEWFAAVLKEQGYTQQEALDVYMCRSLNSVVNQPTLPDGYTIRAFDGELDIVQRAGVQSDAFANEPVPGEWAIENTKRFLRWYAGRRDLDLVAVSSTGEIASFGVFLVDAGTGVGELDPVGTRAKHQRRGLSKAILLSGLHYLKAEGMHSAAVRTAVANTPAIRTYESLGFQVVDHLYRYVKTPNNQ